MVLLYQPVNQLMEDQGGLSGNKSLQHIERLKEQLDALG